MGGMGPLRCIDIVSRSPRPLRAAKDGAIGQLRCVVGRAEWRVRAEWHVRRVAHHKNQTRLNGFLALQQCSSCDNHVVGQLYRRSACSGCIMIQCYHTTYNSPGSPGVPLQVWKTGSAPVTCVGLSESVVYASVTLSRHGSRLKSCPIA